MCNPTAQLLGTSGEQKRCKNCERPVREEYIAPFMDEWFGYTAVYHCDGGDPIFCYEGRGRIEEAELGE